MRHNKVMNYSDCRPGLERVQELMFYLGDPQDNLRYIHLAGTNGKGSTACFLAAILKASGYRTGLFTSPFIHTFNEQIKIDDLAIPDTDLKRIMDKIQIYASVMSDPPTTFEITVAVAFCWFYEMGCDIVVLETGMGGELDATNIIKRPEVTVITPIDMDHMEFLGDNIKKIAKAKAGIIKPGVPVVTARQHPDAYACLRERASKQQASIVSLDLEGLIPGPFSFLGQNFSIGEYENLFIQMLGRYQMENAALALLAMENLYKSNKIKWTIPESAIRLGLGCARWPGRFELAGESPVVIVDGGHNAQGARSLVDNLKRYFPGRRVVFVMGILADKDVHAVIGPVLPLAEQIFTITPDSPRAMEAASLAEYIKGAAGGILVSVVSELNGVASALRSAKKAAGKDGVVCYFGSMYSVGAALSSLWQEDIGSKD